MKKNREEYIVPYFQLLELKLKNKAKLKKIGFKFD